jgi:dTDP-4-dehydrorhamnose reductase
MAASASAFSSPHAELAMQHPILVAGKAGQLARSLAQEALWRGVPLVTMGRPDLDLTDAGSIERAVAAAAPRAIVNAAAYTAVDQAEAEQGLAFAINRDGAARLAASAARLGVPFIHVSTDYVFDGTKDAPYREDDRPSPLGIYGRSKVAGERAVREADPAAVILRTSWVYSRFGRNFVITMLQLAQTREVVRVVDDQHGAPTSASDLARAILDLVERMTGAGAQRCHRPLPPRGRRCDHMARVRGSHFRRMGSPRSPRACAPAHQDHGLPDGGPASAELPARLH